MFRIIICGARTFNDYAILKQVCDQIVGKYQWENYFTYFDEVEVISGRAQGADLLGERWATEYHHWKDGVMLKMKVVPFPLLPEHWVDMEHRPDNEVFPKTRADGRTYNALAGANRNGRMLDYALGADGTSIVIAFYRGKSSGSKQMVKICKKAGLAHFIWDDKKQKIRK